MGHSSGVLTEESVFGTSITRNQRARNTGVVTFRSTLVCLFCLGIVRPSAAANSAPAPRHTRQQNKAFFLSSADPDLPDVAAMIEQVETHMLDGSAAPVHFGFEYLEFSSSFSDPSRRRATASYLLEKYREQTFDIDPRGLSCLGVVSAVLAGELVAVVCKPGLTMKTRAHDGRGCV